MPIIKRYMTKEELTSEQQTNSQFEIGLNKKQEDFTKEENNILKIFKQQENRL